jgi:glycosyltransferase involved in cell wall biosynthesis
VRVLIDSSYAARGRSGTAVYTEQLVAALRARGEVWVVEARQTGRLRPGRSGGRWNPARSAANALLDLLWLHVRLPRAARRARVDVVHHPLPAFSPAMGVPQVATVHDVAYLRMPELYDPAWRRIAARAHRTAARRCAALVCVSQATADDAVALLGAEPDRLVVARHGPGQVERAARAEPPADGHLLFVGDAEPRKNVAGLLAAYAAYRAAADDPAPLVFAGAAARCAREPGTLGRESPSAPELAGLLRGARALVHPALHEGFGLTLLEAMAVGVPVLAVRNAAVEELCADAALLVEPAGLAEGLRRIADDPQLRSRLARAGAERAADYSWERSAQAHERAYTLALATPQ